MKNALSAIIPFLLLAAFIGYGVRADYVWSDSIIKKKQAEEWQVAYTSDKLIGITSPWSFFKTPITQVTFVKPSEMDFYNDLAVADVLRVNYNYSTTREVHVVQAFDCKQNRKALIPEDATKDYDRSKLKWETYGPDEPGARVLQFVCGKVADAIKSQKEVEEEGNQMGELLSSMGSEEWSDTYMNKFRDLFKKLTNRTSRGITPDEANSLLADLQLTADFRDEAANSLVVSWDQKEQITTPKFDELYQKMQKGAQRDKEEANDFMLMLKASASHQGFVITSDGVERDFGRGGIQSLIQGSSIYRSNVNKLADVVKEFTK